jgi:hypothetical protein
LIVIDVVMPRVVPSNSVSMSASDMTLTPHFPLRRATARDQNRSPSRQRIEGDSRCRLPLGAPCSARSYPQAYQTSKLPHRQRVRRNRAHGCRAYKKRAGIRDVARSRGREHPLRYTR